MITSSSLIAFDTSLSSSLSSPDHSEKVYRGYREMRRYLTVSIVSAVIVFPFHHFLLSFLLPISHDYVRQKESLFLVNFHSKLSRTDHPSSPHTPPSNISVTQEQILQFQKQGYLVMRNVLPPNLIESLNQASADLRINKTLHCQMSYYNSPPIFHKEELLKMLLCQASTTLIISFELSFLLLLIT